MKSTKIAIPKGYQLPEGVEAGQTFDENVTFKLEGDKLCLTAINGVSLPGYDDEKGERATPPPDGQFARKYAEAMAANQ